MLKLLMLAKPTETLLLSLKERYHTLDLEWITRHMDEMLEDSGQFVRAQKNGPGEDLDVIFSPDEYDTRLTEMPKSVQLKVYTEAIGNRIPKTKLLHHGVRATVF